MIGLVRCKHTHRSQVVAFLQRSSVLAVSYLGLELPRGIVESRVKCCGLPQGIGPIYQGAAEWQVAYITSTNLLTLVNSLLVSPNQGENTKSDSFIAWKNEPLVPMSNNINMTSIFMNSFTKMDVCR